ncbi:MAG: hypothetical protein U1D35_15895 [Paracoccaceae bacterium]|nr:hypothetical protein [Paracoccaceae bacterium]
MATAIDIDTNVELIRSDDTTAAVIRALDLANKPEFAPDSSSLTALLGGLRAQLGLSQSPSAAAVDPLPAVILKVRAGLQVTRNGNTRVIDLRYTSTSPELSVAIANGFARAHFASILTREERSIARRIARLDIRAGDVRQKAAEAGVRIRADLRKSGLVAVSPQELEKQIFALRQQVSALEAKAAALSAKLSIFATYERTGDLSFIVIDAPESRRLLAELTAAEERLVKIRERTDAAPQATSATESGIDTLRTNLRQEIHLAARAIEIERDMTIAEHDNIAEQIARMGDYLASDDWAELEVARQEKVFYEGMYKEYLTQLEGAGRERQSQPDLRIVADALTPTLPSSPNSKVLLAIAMTLAAFVGICIAALREWNRYGRS